MDHLVVRAAHHREQTEEEILNDDEDERSVVPELERGLRIGQTAMDLLLVFTQRLQHEKHRKVEDNLQRSVVSDTKTEQVLVGTNKTRKLVLGINVAHFPALKRI